MLGALANAIKHHDRVVDGVAGNGEQCHREETVDFQLEEQAEPSEDATYDHNVMGQGD